MTWRTWVTFCVLCVVWGIPYFFIKLALAAGLALILFGSWLGTGGVKHA